MIVRFESLKHENPWIDPVLVLGNVDGFHRGHQALVSMARQKAEARPVVLVTFSPHPSQVLGRAKPLLFPRSTMESLWLRAGLDGVFYFNFNLEFSKLTAIEFLQSQLRPLLNPSRIVVGFNFRFGFERTGQASMISQSLSGLPVDIVAPVLEGSEAVSSSRIRQLIAEGKMDLASRCLGFPFFVQGQVQQGEKRGRLLGFPTLNLQGPESLMPPEGVYATRALIKGHNYFSISHWGSNKTFDQDRPNLETHVLDFSEDIYGETVEISFIEKIRETQKFAGIEALKAGLESDRTRAREIFKL